MTLERQMNLGRRAFNPSSIFPPFSDYSHGILVNSGPVVITSGQFGISADGSVPRTVEEQAEICFSNIDAILEQAGMKREHIVRLNAHVTNRVHMSDYMQVRDHYFEKLITKPASSMMIVTGFIRPEFLIEIDAMAIASDEQTSL